MVFISQFLQYVGLAFLMAILFTLVAAFGRISTPSPERGHPLNIVWTLFQRTYCFRPTMESGMQARPNVRIVCRRKRTAIAGWAGSVRKVHKKFSTIRAKRRICICLWHSIKTADEKPLVAADVAPASWTAPAERSDDGAFARARRNQNKRATFVRTKAVSRFTCHRSPGTWSEDGRTG
jgi:hypothetical protein